MLNTVCSRIVDQTDLIMMKRIGDNCAAALITLKNLTFIDFIVALTFVPIFSVMVRKGSSTENKIELLKEYTKKYILIVFATLFMCVLLYPLIINFCVKDIELRKLVLLFLIPLLINLPGKMLQFYGTSILCSFNKANYVSIMWICVTVMNLLLNILFIKLFGSIGCLISTAVLTLFICSVIYFILQKSFNIFSKSAIKINMKEVKKPLLSEGCRIIIEKASGYLGFFIVLQYSTIQYINWTGISSEIMSLFLVPLIASMRSSTISFTENQNQYRDIKNKIEINILLSFVLTIIFYIFSNVLIKGFYSIEEFNEPFFVTYKICFPAILLFNAFNSIFIGFLQFKLKQSFYFKVDSIINWFVLLPLTFLIFRFHFEYFYFGILLVSIAMETLFLGKKVIQLLKESE